MMNEQERIEWLEERSQKLMELEDMIINMQSNINDNKRITNIDDIKMEIFKLWYFNEYNKKYDD